ncbi:glutamine-hydrolyzing GMP synthase [bacterium]|nr:glutamine-hydrolyzing GMP synthase [bacterium]
MPETILILDLGSQYTQLIARRVREKNVYSEIVPHTIKASEVRARSPKGIILSGGPASVYDHGAPTIEKGLLDLGVPVLGICYGLQLGAELLGSKVAAAPEREFGRTECSFDTSCDLFKSLKEHSVVWMSHGDRVDDLKGDFRAIARTASSPQAAVQHRTRPFFGVQFHPEVAHTEQGGSILENFVRGICGCKGDWNLGDFIDLETRKIRDQVGEKGRVICGLSGGIDSAVVALIVDRAVGERLVCIFVDNGLLRQGEVASVEAAFRPRFGNRLRVVSAAERFLERLRGVTEPERKRREIGHEFIAVFKEAAQGVEGARFLAQGTLYPDVIESLAAHGGPTATIKTHHNVGGLPAELGFELVEPLRFLFKDEVRALAKTLGLPPALVRRQPFPGPGLAVRCLGEVTAPRLRVLAAADAIVQEEFEKAGLLERIWQSFAVLLPVKTVGVMGDQRTYEEVCALRAVDSQDGMTADWVRVPYDLLQVVASRIVNEVRGINRVCYDVTSKPPGTIEWE